MPETATPPPIPRKKQLARPYSGNAPLFDQHGYVDATIIAIKEWVKNEGTPHEWRAYQWLLESAGSLRPWEWSELTVRRVSPPRKNGEKSSLLTLMVALGLVTLDDVRAQDVPMEMLKPAIGRVVRWHGSYRKDGYYRVDFSTLVVTNKA